MFEGPASFPVELEPPRGPRRRHRLITAPSGLVLFVCLFLPAVEVCGSPTYPIEVWPLATPYLLGLLVGILALVTGPRAVAGLVLAVRAVIWVTVVGWTVYLVGLAVTERDDFVLPGLVWLFVGVSMVWMFGRGRRDEAAAARVTIATAVVCCVWFGLFCFDPGSLFGIYLSATAAVGLLIGGLEWRREVQRDHPPPRARLS
jgi:hypothetical protein